MKSVVHCLNTVDFARVRVGIGQPDDDIPLVEHVIGPIDEKDKQLLEDGVEKATLAVEEIMKSGLDIAMNKYN